MDSDERKALYASAEQAIKSGDLQSAYKKLRAAENSAAKDYYLALKLSKLSAKLIRADTRGSLPLKSVKIALLSSSTTTFFEPLFTYFGLAKSLSITLKCGDFGNWRQDMLNPNSWLREFSPDFILITLNYRDLPLEPQTSAPDSLASKFASELASYWAAAKKSCPNATIIQSDLDSPSEDSGGLLSFKYGGRANTLARVSSAISETASKAGGVEVLPLSELRAEFGAKKWEDKGMWFYAKQHPNMEALPLVAQYAARIISAKITAPKKVCVLDLDNTLWGGIIGEDGLEGIELGAPSPRGEAFAAFQRYLKELKSRGILLCVCSKNNEADALLPFEKHDAMILKRNDIVCFSANWKPKSEAIAKMASELNLGLDSFVFIDDNPAEIEEVKSALPQVVSLLLPDDPANFIEFLSDKALFDVLEVSQDDLKRSETYKQNADRARAFAKADSLEDFLISLDMSCVCEKINSTNIARAAQLTAKTNQFNLTTRRESEAKIKSFAGDVNNYAKCFRLSDKFGDNGIVGIALASPVPGSKTLSIDSFIMSCRVIGRGLEDLMLDDICRFASDRGFERVRGIYIATPKNSQTAGFYQSRGFVPEASPGNEKYYSADPREIALKTHIKLIGK